MAELSEQLKAMLRKQKYGVVGRHSAIEICGWTKKALRDEGFCYKQQFYGIRTHRCVQMSPAVLWCDHRCIFCWRAVERTIGTEMDGELDSPKDIIDGCIQAQREKLKGLVGNPKVNQQKLKEAMEPAHFAISLSGEPTLYPALPQLIRELHARGITTFLVTNGMHPEALKRLAAENALPTQLYVSVDAPNEQLYRLIDRPAISDGWRRLGQTLKLLPKLNCRKVIRITLIKGLNDCCISEWAELVQKANPQFVEVKGYVWVGHSRQRMAKEHMPYHEDVMQFAEQLACELGWKIIDEKRESRVALLMKEDLPGRVMRFD